MNDTIRPRDLAVLLLAMGDDPPRDRARDQQADRAGLALRRDVLDRLAALDPEPHEIDASLAQIVQDLGEPSGPSRAIALSILQEWESSKIGPGYWSWLVSEALAAGDGPRPRRKRRDGDDVA